MRLDRPRRPLESERGLRFGFQLYQVARPAATGRLSAGRCGTFAGGQISEPRNVVCRARLQAISQTGAFSRKGFPAGDYRGDVSSDCPPGGPRNWSATRPRSPRCWASSGGSAARGPSASAGLPEGRSPRHPKLPPGPVPLETKGWAVGSRSAFGRRPATPAGCPSTAPPGRVLPQAAQGGAVHGRGRRRRRAGAASWAWMARSSRTAF